MSANQSQLTKIQKRKLTFLRKTAKRRGLSISLSRDRKKIIVTNSETGIQVCTQPISDLS